jgi:hypothetical protein
MPHVASDPSPSSNSFNSPLRRSPSIDIDYANLIKGHISNLTTLFSAGDSSLILQAIPPFLDAFLPNITLPGSFFIESGLWSQLISALISSYDNPVFFDEICFLMARIIFFTNDVATEFSYHVLDDLIQFFLANPERPHYYLINLMANVLSASQGILHLYNKNHIAIEILSRRPLLECDLVFLSHLAPRLDFDKENADALAFLNLLVSYIPIYLENDLRLFRILLFLLNKCCRHCSKKTTFAPEFLVGNCLGVFFQLLSFPDPLVLEPVFLILCSIVECLALATSRSCALFLLG